MNDRLDPFVEGYRSRLDTAVADREIPDLDVVVRRAAVLNPDAVPLDFDGVASERDPEYVAALSPLVQAYRERLDEQIEVSSGACAPRSRVRPWMLVASLAAAALVVVWGVGELRAVRAQQHDDAQARSAAVDASQREVADGQASERQVQRVPSRTQRRATAPRVEPVTPQAPDVPQVPGAATDKPVAINKKLDRDERIAALDAQARRAWKEGDRGTAQRRFRTIVKIGGRRKAVEIAFAELFSLVRQQGKQPVADWKAYLRRFPQGRYAADAHAGLCSAIAAAERDACWERYRQRFPGGKHRGRP